MIVSLLLLLLPLAYPLLLLLLLLTYPGALGVGRQGAVVVPLLDHGGDFLEER